MLFLQQDTLATQLIMITRGKWIILLLPILGSCKKPPTSVSINRAVGCTNTTLCWNHHHHLCLPCDYDHQDADADADHQDDKTSPPHEPKIGSDKDVNWPPKIEGRHSLPPARNSLKNRIKDLVFLPTPTKDDWKEDKKVAHKRNKIDPQNNRMSVMRMMSGEDKSKKVKGDGSPRDCQDRERKEKEGCFIYVTEKCIQCKEFREFLKGTYFPTGIDRWRGDPKNPHQINIKEANKRNKIVSLEEQDYDDEIKQSIPFGCPATFHEHEHGWCFIFASEKCIPCVEFVEFIFKSPLFPDAIDKLRAKDEKPTGPDCSRVPC